MMGDAQTVLSLFSNHVDAEQLKEKSNVIKLNKQNKISIAIQFVKRKEVVEYMYATPNVVNLKTISDLKHMYVSSLAKDY